MTDKHETQVIERENPDSTQDDSSAAEELSDELLEVELNTVDDKTVRAEVTEARPIGSKILLEAEVPGGETVSEQFTKPVPWSTRYKFARIVEAQGYGPGTTHHLKGEQVLLTRTDDDTWEFNDPKGVRYYWDHHRVACGAVGGVVLLGIIGIAAIIQSNLSFLDLLEISVGFLFVALAMMIGLNIAMSRRDRR